MIEPFVDASTVAGFLAITRRQVLELARTGKIPATRCSATDEKCGASNCLKWMPPWPQALASQSLLPKVGPWPRRFPHIECLSAVLAARRGNSNG
jgi:hypothetical protein